MIASIFVTAGGDKCPDFRYERADIGLSSNQALNSDDVSCSRPHRGSEKSTIDSATTWNCVQPVAGEELIDAFVAVLAPIIGAGDSNIRLCASSSERPFVGLRAFQEHFRQGSSVHLAARRVVSFLRKNELVFHRVCGGDPDRAGTIR